MSAADGTSNLPLSGPSDHQRSGDVVRRLATPHSKNRTYLNSSPWPELPVDRSGGKVIWRAPPSKRLPSRRSGRPRRGRPEYQLLTPTNPVSGPSKSGDHADKEKTRRHRDRRRLGDAVHALRARLRSDQRVRHQQQAVAKNGRHNPTDHHPTPKGSPWDGTRFSVGRNPCHDDHYPGNPYRRDSKLRSGSATLVASRASPSARGSNLFSSSSATTYQPGP